MSRVLIFFLLATNAFAGALFPSIKATSSKNGNYLAIVQTSPEKPEFAVTVFPREPFTNSKDHLEARATHWTDYPIWSIVLTPDQLKNEPEYPLPLISDDGEFVILISTGPVFQGQVALSIHRRRDHRGDLLQPTPDHGVLVKNVLIDEFPQEISLSPNRQGWNDETSQWFAGGSFDFSDDNRQLIFKTREGALVRIGLTASK